LLAAASVLIPFSARADSGDTTDALPGVVRVPVLAPAARGLALSGSGGYGYTESVLGKGDSYSRASGALAVSYQPLSYFAAALRFDGRYDVDTGAQKASGFTGDPRLELRFMAPLGDALRLGGQLGIWTPGASAPSLPAKAITPDLSALATYAPPGSALLFTSRLGVRWDNSAESVPHLADLALPDRVELGLNQASAVLVGLGAEYRLSPSVELLGDLTWDALFGSKAPPVGDDPILLSAGARGALDADGKVQLEGFLTVSPSGRPTVAPTAPLVDIEPRVSLLVGVVIRPFATRPVAPAPVVGPEAVGAVPAGGPTRVRLRGHATAEDGKTPLAHAHVVVTRITPAGAPPATDAEKQETDADADGRFETGELPVGDVKVVITAPGFKPVEKTVTLSATPEAVEVTATHALPAGEVRGVVRDLGGRPVKATVRVEPVGVDVTVAADGTFRTDVQPGSYDVIIRAPGYADQKRHVTIERDAVFLLNVELRKK
jgi:hypothetical protein